MVTELSLADLVEKSGLPLRTIRFYIQEGLLPSPDSRGKNAKYSLAHLERLELIQRFKDLHLPLQEIRKLFENIKDDEIPVLLQGQRQISESAPAFSNFSSYKSSDTSTKESALDYIKALQANQSGIKEITNSRNRTANSAQALPTPTGSPKPRIAQSADKTENWQRIIIKDGIELNIRIPVSVNDKKKINELFFYLTKTFKP